MKQTTQSLLAVVFGAIALGVAVTPAQALTVYQTQSNSSSADLNMNCTGTCDASAHTSMSQSQTQQVQVNETTEYVPVTRVVNAYYPARRYVRVQPAYMYIVENVDGQVRLGWGYRGGTCHVRYSEANQAAYKYATSAGCDEGGVTIGGLNPGQKYRFQVRQDFGYWSRPMVIKAE